MQKVMSKTKENEEVSRRIFTAAFSKKAALRFAETAAIVVLAFIFSQVFQKSSPIPKEDYRTPSTSIGLNSHS